MRKFYIVGLVAALVALAAAAAGAHGWGPGPGYGMMGSGYGMMAPQAQEEYAKFMQDTLELRKQLSSKMMELRTLWAQPDPDKTKLDGLRNEVYDLQKQLAQKADEAGIRNYAGQRGYGRGYGRGPASCPGYGGGYGGGPGACGGGGCW